MGGLEADAKELAAATNPQPRIRDIMKTQNLTAALLASLALASLFTGGCVAGAEEESMCDEAGEADDCDEDVGDTEDAITAGIDPAAAKQSCESRHHVWKATNQSCGGCATGYVASGDQCISKAQRDCDLKDGVWQNGHCITAIQCPAGQHPVQGFSSQYCEWDGSFGDPNAGLELPCEVGLTCPPSLYPGGSDPWSSTHWVPMGPGCMEPNDPACFH